MKNPFPFFIILALVIGNIAYAIDNTDHALQTADTSKRIDFDDCTTYVNQQYVMTPILGAPEWDADDKYIVCLAEVMPERPSGPLIDSSALPPSDSFESSQVGTLYPRQSLVGPKKLPEKLEYKWTAVEPYINTRFEPNLAWHQNPRSRVLFDGDLFSITVRIDEKQPLLGGMFILDMTQQPQPNDDPRIVSATPVPQKWFPWVEEAFKHRKELKKMTPQALTMVALDMEAGTFVRLLALKNLKGNPQACATVIKNMLITGESQPEMATEFLLAQAVISMGGEKLPELTDLCDAAIAKNIKDHPHGSRLLNAYAAAMQSASDYGLCDISCGGPTIWFHGAFLDLKRSRWCAARMDYLFSQLKTITDKRFTPDTLSLYMYAAMGEGSNKFTYPKIEKSDAYYESAYKWAETVKEKKKREDRDRQWKADAAREEAQRKLDEAQREKDDIEHAELEKERQAEAARKKAIEDLPPTTPYTH